MKLRLALSLVVTCALLLCTGCSTRAPVPPGTVPQQTTVSAEDEQYGHQVLGSLTQQFALDNDDAKINRVRDIADRLAIASGNDQNPWHIHVLKDDSVKNAAATRGNYLFVWTGMFQTVRSDTELATIISHEMGHVLGGHTAASPEQETAAILSGVMGIAASSALSIGGYGGLSDLAQILIENVMQAAIVNPQSQSDELEADHIGLFLMADAAYDPDEALAFWTRVQSDPDFQSASLAFFSSHPSTVERVQALSSYIDTARERYQMARGVKPKKGLPAQPPVPGPKNLPVPPPPVVNKPAAGPDASSRTPINAVDRWMVASEKATVYEEADPASEVEGTVNAGEMVEGRLVKRRWIQIDEPMEGYIRSSDLSPLK